MVVADRVSRLVSGINPGPVVGGQLGRSFRIGFPVWLRVLILALLFRSDFHLFGKKQKKL